MSVNATTTENPRQTRILQLDEKEVKKLFETAADQEEALIGIYRMVFPMWDQIEKINGFPKVNRATNIRIGNMAQAFDEKHHPDVMSGGLWLNNGFSSLDSESLKDWEVDLSACTITFNQEMIDLT